MLYTNNTKSLADSATVANAPAASSASTTWSTSDSVTNRIANANGIWANSAIVSVDFSQINYPSPASNGGGLLTNEMFPASAKPTNTSTGWTSMNLCPNVTNEVTTPTKLLFNADVWTASETNAPTLSGLETLEFGSASTTLQSTTTARANNDTKTLQYSSTLGTNRTNGVDASGNLARATSPTATTIANIINQFGGVLITGSGSTQSKSIFDTVRTTSTKSSNSNFGTQGTPTSHTSTLGTSRTNALSDSVNAAKATSTMSIIADGADWTNAAPSPSTTTGIGQINEDKDQNSLTISSGTTTLTHNGLTWTLIEKDGYKILEATEVATVRACDASDSKAKVKYLDIHYQIL